MRMVILGAPGSGRTTQAKMLAERHKVPQISVDLLLHEAIAADRKIATALKSGRLLADDLAIDRLTERLRKRDGKRGFVISDFPRNIPQAQSLDTLLGMFGWTLQIALHISVDDDTLVRRITGRQTCQQCGAVYNRNDFPPRRRGKCDECDGKVVTVPRATAKAAREVVDEYHEKTEVLLTYYKAQHKLRTVIAEKKDNEMEKKICGIVDLEIHPLELRPLETAAETHDEEINTVIVGGQINRVTPPPTRARRSRVVAKKTANKTVTKKSTAKKTPKKKTTRKKSSARVTKKTQRKKPAHKKK